MGTCKVIRDKSLISKPPKIYSNLLIGQNQFLVLLGKNTTRLNIVSYLQRYDRLNFAKFCSNFSLAQHAGAPSLSSSALSTLVSTLVSVSLSELLSVIAFGFAFGIAFQIAGVQERKLFFLSSPPRKKVPKYQ